MSDSVSKLKIFMGNSHLKLANEISEKLNIKMGEASVERFSDGEISVTLKESVRGDHVFVIQSTCYPANENLMELLIMIDSLKRDSVGKITAVIPYFGYARQDRKAKPRDPITAKLIANMIEKAGANSIITMDFHAPQLQGFFDIPVNHLLGIPILSKYFKSIIGDYNDLVIASPDIGSVTRARSFSQKFNCPIAIIDKRRQKANHSEVMNVIGNVKNKRVIIIDDLIDTGGTIVNGANALMEVGAKEIYACCTHAVLSGPAIDRIEKSCIKELVVLNTIPLNDEKKIGKIKVLSVADNFAEVIHRIYNNISISPVIEEQ